MLASCRHVPYHQLSVNPYAPTLCTEARNFIDVKTGTHSAEHSRSYVSSPLTLERVHERKRKKSATCTSTVPPSSCYRAPLLLSSAVNIALTTTCPSESYRLRPARPLSPKTRRLGISLPSPLACRLSSYLCDRSALSASPRHHLPSICPPFVFILLRIAFSATPVFSQPSALPGGVTPFIPSCLSPSPYSVRHDKFNCCSNLPPLFLSSPSFPHLFLLFSIACSLFAQKTGGGYPHAVSRQYLFSPQKRRTVSVSDPLRGFCAMLLLVISSEPA